MSGVKAKTPLPTYGELCAIVELQGLAIKRLRQRRYIQAYRVRLNIGGVRSERCLEVMTLKHLYKVKFDTPTCMARQFQLNRTWFHRVLACLVEWGYVARGHVSQVRVKTARQRGNFVYYWLTLEGELLVQEILRLEEATPQKETDQ